MQTTITDKGNLEYWHKVYPIRSGWTDDEKYKVCDDSGHAFFLRKATRDRFQDLQEEARLITALGEKGLPVAKVETVDLCEEEDKCYLLLHWLEGVTLETALPGMSEREQYEIGLKAGRQLLRLHNTKLDINAFSHRSLKDKKMRELNGYLESGLRISGDSTIIDFIRDNIHVIDNGPSVIEHSDYHPGNLILKPGMDLAIIDFNGSHQGDAYEEFYKLELFVIRQSIAYCLGQIHGYFDGDPPRSFWDSHSVYTAHAALYGLKWAQDHGKAESMEIEINRLKRILRDYDHFNRRVPAWYVPMERYRNQ